MKWKMFLTHLWTESQVDPYIHCQTIISSNAPNIEWRNTRIYEVNPYFDLTLLTL